jgi:FdhD protein
MASRHGVRATVHPASAVRYAPGRVPEPRPDEVAVEEPLQVLLQGEPFTTTMRTPGHDHELVAGLLFYEGVVGGRDALGALRHCGSIDDEGYGNVIDVLPAPGTAFDAEAVAPARRSRVTTSACGVCGRRTVDELLERVPPLEAGRTWPRAELAALPVRLRAEQPGFDRTGGLHAAGIAIAPGESLVVREDVGRHNAVDKVIGRLVLDAALPVENGALVVSGRVSFEIAHKALVARVPIVVAVSAPTSLAVSLAERSGMTLIGFCRDGGYSVYSGAERIA